MAESQFSCEGMRKFKVTKQQNANEIYSFYFSFVKSVPGKGVLILLRRMKCLFNREYEDGGVVCRVGVQVSQCK